MRPLIALKLSAATLAFGAIAGLALVPDALSQTAAPRPARYDMDVGTATGVGMGSISLSSILGGGGNNEPRKELFLRLGSSQAATGPRADHFMPEGARLGTSVPLITPVRTPDEQERLPGERPRGRILIFWGCGAHAPAGQPVVIDLARLSAGQVPPGLFSSTVPRDRSVTFSNSRTYGDWPNGTSRAQLRSQSSIIGAHRIAGNYSPEIAFSLAQDFMPALNATGTAQADQSTQLAWNSVAGATGYYAWTMGFRGQPGGDSGDMVMWSSSSSQQFGGGLWDWIAPETVARLVNQRVVMPPSQTACVVPMEVKQAAPDIMFGNLYAYGPEANFAYPPRPANARTPWHPIWQARVRYRSSTSWMIGGPGAEAANNPNPNCRRRRGGLGGVLGGVLGAPAPGC
ncbi:MAG: hypothetical protein ABL909_08950 [Sphingopyxis sp.]